MNVHIILSVILLSIHSLNSEKMGCKSTIFCQGDILRVVLTSGVFRDSKTFVDMSLRNTVARTMKYFDRMMTRTGRRPTKQDIMEFLQHNFQASHDELEQWYPTDYQVNPPFLRKIKDVRVRNTAKRLLDLWPSLGRKIKPEVLQTPFKYSIIPVPNGFIIPGGRFREMYYWDSYWIIKGLLICGMKHTVKGMIENFFSIIGTYGFIPNGGRVYYLDRSQPPLLTMMVADFMEYAKDILWLKKSIKYMEKELTFWLEQKTITVDKSGKKYRLARYRSFEDSPRPESYIEDIHTASMHRTEDQRREFYMNIRTGAETGWDFSGRWFFDKQGGNRADLATIKPTRIIPVDLNAFLCNSFKILSEFYTKLKDRRKSRFWHERYTEWMKSIQDILYSPEDGIWYDYDIELGVPRKHFYPSNFAPLWTETYNTKEKRSFGRNATHYLQLQGIMKYEGGIPTSLYETGEQWDLPNAWAPTQAIVIFGLDKTEDATAQRIAQEFAVRWIDSLIQVANQTNEMFEKYNAVFRGMYGGGGEYEVQKGFGWTNGVMLELIEHYYIKKRKLED